MAAKRKLAPIKPRTDLPYSELLQTQQNALYVKALHEYGQGKGPNPGSKSTFHREKIAADGKT